MVVVKEYELSSSIPSSDQTRDLKIVKKISWKDDNSLHEEVPPTDDVVDQYELDENAGDELDLKAILKVVQSDSNQTIITTKDYRLHPQIGDGGGDPIMVEESNDHIKDASHRRNDRYLKYLLKIPPWFQVFFMTLILCAIITFFVVVDKVKTETTTAIADMSGEVDIVMFKIVESLTAGGTILCCLGVMVFLMYNKWSSRIRFSIFFCSFGIYLGCMIASISILLSAGYQFFVNRLDKKFNYCEKYQSTLLSFKKTTISDFDYPTIDAWMMIGGGRKFYYVQLLPFFIVFSTFSTLLISFSQIWRHCYSYNYPPQQRFVIRIVLSALVYSVLSFLQLLFHRHFLVFDVMRGFYEAYTVYSYYWLIRYSLGETTVKQSLTMALYLDMEAKEVCDDIFKNSEKIRNVAKVYLEERKKTVMIPFLSRFFKYNPTKESFLKATENFVMVFILWKIITTISTIVMNMLNVYCIEFTSFNRLTIFIISLFGLFSSYSVSHLATNAHPALVGHGLENKRFRTKNLAVMLLLNIPFYQGNVLSVLFTVGVSYYKATLDSVLPTTATWNFVEIQSAVTALLINFEMFWLAIYFSYAFPAYPYHHHSDPKKLRLSLIKSESIDKRYRETIKRRGVFSDLRGMGAFFDSVCFVNDTKQFLEMVPDTTERDGGGRV